jgi:hypothetical protein
MIKTHSTSSLSSLSEHYNSSNSIISDTMETKTTITTKTNKDMLYRFPKFIKPFYEITLHKKPKNDYNLAIAVPLSKRAYLWFTYIEHKPVACVIEVGRNQELLDHVHFLTNFQFPEHFALGTLLSGYWIDGEEHCPERRYFVADNIFLVSGHEFDNPFPIPFERKFMAYCDFFSNLSKYGLVQEIVSVHSVYMWQIDPSTVSEDGLQVPDNFYSTIGYDLKYIQLRSIHKVLPYVNQLTSSNPWKTEASAVPYDTIHHNNHGIGVWSTIGTSGMESVSKIQVPDWNWCHKNPVYQHYVYMWVRADVAYDVYYYYVQNDTLFDMALIMDTNTSVKLNKLFRSIPENSCLDTVEESDDEDEFLNLRYDRFVNLEKKLLFRCSFNTNFKKWVPIDHLEPTESNIQRVPPIQSFIHRNRQSNHRSTHDRSSRQHLRQHQSSYKKKNPSTLYREHHHRQNEQLSQHRHLSSQPRVPFQNGRRRSQEKEIPYHSRKEKRSFQKNTYESSKKVQSTEKTHRQKV